MSGELRLFMLIRADTQSARAAIAGLKGETEALGASAEKAGRSAATGTGGVNALAGATRATAADFRRLADSGEDVSGILNALRAAANPLVGGYLSLQNALRGVAEAEELGVLTAREAALATDQMARAQAALRPLIEAGGGAIEANTRAVIQHESALQRLIATTTGMASAEGESVAAMLQRGQALDALRARFDPLFATSRAYEIELEQIAEAERQGAFSAAVAAQARERAAQQLTNGVAQLGRASQATSHYVTQLGYQVNDIGMMVAAGQSPFLLALQQGTSVAQVFNDMRMQGLALGPAIRGALLSMVSPISLVTLGVIALGAFAVQALLSMREETVSAEEAIKSLQGSVRDFGQEAGRSAADIVRDFGSITAATAELQRNLTALSETKALNDLLTTIKALREQSEGSWMAAFNDKAFFDRTQVASLLFKDAVPASLEEGYRRSSAISTYQAGMDRLQSASGAAARLAAVRDLSEQFQSAAGGIEQMNTAQATYYGQLLAVEESLNRVVVLEARRSQQALDLARASGTENARMGGPTAADLNPARDPAQEAAARASAADLLRTGREEIELARLKAVYGAQSAEVRAEEARQAQAALEQKIAELGIDRQGLQAQQMRGQLAVQQAQAEAARVAALNQSAAQTVAQYEAQARIAELTRRYGADSLEVAYARAAAEREVVVAQIEAQGYSAQQSADLLAAWDAASGIASVNMAAGIGAAAAEAQLLAANMGISLQQTLGIVRLAAQAKPQSAPRVGWGTGSALSGFGSGTSLTYGDNPGSGRQTVDVSAPSVGKGGAGGGAKEEANAVADLITQLERQNAALRVLDPIQQEIEKNHDALAKATDAERQKVSDLIAERMRLEQIRSALEEIGQTGKSAFVGLVTGAHSFADAIAMVIEKLADMAASAAWDALWNGGLSGLLGGLLGGSGGTGSFGLPMPFADGGRVGGKITGPGGPRDDRILIRASAEEYIVNAAATRARLPLVEAINAGASVPELMRVLAGMNGPELGASPLTSVLGEGASLGRMVDLIGARAPAFADGGLVGASAPSSWRSASASGGVSGALGQSGNGSSEAGRLDIRLFVDADGNWQAKVEEIAGGVSARVTQAGIEQFSRRGLPARVAQISADPRKS